MNSKTIYIFCTLHIIFCSHVFSQNIEPQTTDGFSTSLAISSGISDFHQRDKYFSPLIFNGVNFASKLSIQMKTENNRHSIDGFFTIGALNPDIPQREVTLKGGYLSYSFVHLLNTENPIEHPLQFFLGGGISSFVVNTDFDTEDETGYTKLDQSWYWSHSLNVVFQSEYRFVESKNFMLRLTVPIVGLVSRPENGHRLKQNNLDVVDDNFFNAATQGKMDYLWKSFVIYTDIEYRQSLSSTIDFLASYRFSYISSNKPASALSTGMYMNNFLAGIEWVL